MYEYVESLFCNLKQEKGDINEHLDTLKKLASECDTVVELGVRWMVSIIAFVVSGCKSVNGYDFNHPNIYGDYRFKQVEDYCKKYNINFNFYQQDALKIEDFPTCDLLFIDTYHTFRELKCELFLYHDKVKKYIVCHDTEIFANHDEKHWDIPSWFARYENYPKILNLVDINDQREGLKLAIDEFLKTHNNWKLTREYQNNNGLIILERTN